MKLIIKFSKDQNSYNSIELVSETYAPALRLYLRKKNNWLHVGTDYIG